MFLYSDTDDLAGLVIDYRNPAVVHISLTFGLSESDDEPENSKRADHKDHCGYCSKDKLEVADNQTLGEVP